MAHGFGVVALAGTGIAINTVYTIGHGRDPFPTILAGAIFTSGCVLVGAARPEVGTAIAAVYLLSTVLTRGEYFISFAEDLVNSPPSKKEK